LSLSDDLGRDVDKNSLLGFLFGGIDDLVIGLLCLGVCGCGDLARARIGVDTVFWGMLADVLINLYG
jgi:hypothetical protein